MATSRSDGRPEPSLRIGTRGSPLALAQADETRARLIAAHPQLAAPGGIEICVIKTTGDKVQDRPLTEIGGKGLFTKEIEEALARRARSTRGPFHEGRADLAARRPGDRCLLPREDPRDVLIATAGTSIATLPRGAVVGTASLRRAAQLHGAAAGSLDRAAARQCRDAHRQGAARRCGRDPAGARRARSACASRMSRPPSCRSTRSCPRSRRAPSASRPAPATIASTPCSRRSTTARRNCASPPSAPALRCSTDHAARRSRRSRNSTGDVMRLRALIALPDGSQVHRQDATGTRIGRRGVGRADRPQAQGDGWPRLPVLTSSARFRRGAALPPL